MSLPNNNLQQAPLHTFGNEQQMPHYLKAITKSGNSRIELTIQSHKLELESLNFKINNLSPHYSYQQYRAWRARRRKVKNTIKFLSAIVANTIKARIQAGKL
jgi:hypothetical protein